MEKKHYKYQKRRGGKTWDSQMLRHVDTGYLAEYI